jgi:hypothetical protein
MEITKKHVFLLIFSFILYGYLIDSFKKPGFTDKLIGLIGNATNNKTHSFFNLIQNGTNSFASAVSISCTTIIGCLPVRYFQSFFFFKC